jgi:hypothetical protein
LSSFFDDVPEMSDSGDGAAVLLMPMPAMVNGIPFSGIIPLYILQFIFTAIPIAKSTVDIAQYAIDLLQSAIAK